MDQQFWEDRYGERDQLFSGDPNGVLVTEVTGLEPGQALDVGCGEGGDAIWLARQGWRVTAIDISKTALRRAAANSADLADRVAWTHGDLTTTPLPSRAFDLVSLQYFPLPRGNPATLRTLLDTVVPGGNLLFVSHDISDLDPDPERGFDPGDFFQPADAATLLDENWTVLVDETRPRNTPPPEGTRHTHDTVLRARRDR
ncbi:SAM-dependent methyltransferase [Prauserella marina]|uniref:Methyltransferase domain-containing protein n=1 Tax=Prauserella marina TaxID=530584 RepID=A0A222VV38_9PSEU|nr:class I SAM-dependent methyltransferase [Prauserella marina]ASR37593.1 SAM-dependent methyltransferase [Prauserella marina]PWV75500.1 methyltransferase family protein [Prauserella marina]SDD33166.1 Methyltransferase domain-containing protein [Prauserella marina]